VTARKWPAIRRALEYQQGVEFEQSLIDDGHGGLSTRHRVSTRVLTEAGITGEALKQGGNLVAKGADGHLSLPAFHTVTEWKGPLEG
jgi:hypothetical protein